jgi:hypothetical protein
VTMRFEEFLVCFVFVFVFVLFWYTDFGPDTIPDRDATMGFKVRL